MWSDYYAAQTLDQALELLSQHAPAARVVAGATDLILELERDVRPDVDCLIDISRIPDLDHIRLDEKGIVHLGPLVTHNHCAGSELIQERAFCLAKACWEVGAPQIRNRATVAGNLITASPANDSITPLMALGASVHLQRRGGSRTVPLTEFYRGVRQTVMEPDELLVEISFPLPPESSRSSFFKLGLRRAQAISVVNAAVLVNMEGSVVREAVVALGAVNPIISRAAAAEDYLLGKELSEDTCLQAGRLAQQASAPIDDIRGSSAYRQQMVAASVSRVLFEIGRGEEREGFPQRPVMLWGGEEFHWTQKLDHQLHHDKDQPIETMINGRPYRFESGQKKTLLRLLREEGGLTGTKEGCAEGECGACTVFLDGMAVMACMVPAPRAHGSEIVTVEGLALGEQLHPVQEAFIDRAAVQCGYCIPGFIMSGAKLLEENPHPERWHAQQAVTGNLCRCTGYYKILDAIELAGRTPRQPEGKSGA